MKSILVTGSDSQLANCIKDLSDSFSKLDIVFKNSKELDITDEPHIEKVFQENKFDYCINCAAYTAVDKAEQEPSKAEEVNVKGSIYLAENCKRFDTVLVHISTDFVFDGTSLRPYTEIDKTNPINIYGETKLEGENGIIKLLEKYFVIRTSWLYSEYGSNFLKTMLKIAERKSDINVIDDQIGSPTYALDLAQIILEIINRDDKLYGVYHFSNSGHTSWYGFAKEIFRLTNSSINLKKISSKAYNANAMRPKYSVLNNNKIQKNYGFVNSTWKTSLKTAIKNLEMQKLKNIAIKAALMAGKEIMSVYNSEIKVELKNDKSPLTKADKESNRIINSFLIPTNIPIISEENKQIDYEIRKLWNTCWIVDPVDGTKEFIKRNGEFTVNIALVRDGEPLLGVIYVPVTKELYYADVSNKSAKKAVLKAHEYDENELLLNSVSLKPKTDKKIINVVGSRSHMNDETKLFIEKLESQGKTTSIVSKGSSLKFCLVADGSADIYPRFAPTMEWDTAAGQAICNAVGIEVMSQATSKPLQYNKENLLNPWFLVGKI